MPGIYQHALQAGKPIREGSRPDLSSLNHNVFLVFGPKAHFETFSSNFSNVGPKTTFETLRG